MTPLDLVALEVAGLLGNGMGGYDWAGLPVVAAWMGIDDVEGLLQRLSVIRRYRPARLRNDD